VIERQPQSRWETGRSPLCLGTVAGLAAVLLGSVPAGVAAAQEAATPATEAAQTLERKKSELNTAQSKAAALQGDVQSLDGEREKLNADLLDMASRIQKSEGQLTAIEGRLAELEAQEKIVRGSLEQRHGQIAQLLGALQRMGRNPPPVLITRREDALKMVRSAMLLATAFPELKEQASGLSERLDELMRVTKEIREEGDRLRSESTRLAEAQTRITALMQEKKANLTQRQTELASVRAETNEISRNVGDLTELITRLDKTVTEKTGLGAYNSELQGAKAPAVADAKPAAPAPIRIEPPAENATPEPAPASEPKREERVAALTPPPQLKPHIIEIAPVSGMTGASPGRIKPAIPFASAHTKLPLPAQGRRVLAFGEKTQYGANSKGMVIETRSGAQVTSPCDGWIAYAGEFRSYGQLLIINAGDGYHVLLAGMSQIDVQPGQFVLAAEPIGTMSGANKTAQPAVRDTAPVLYVEFRKDGRPIDPDPWWVAGQQKVQG